MQAGNRTVSAWLDFFWVPETYNCRASDLRWLGLVYQSVRLLTARLQGY